MKSVWLWKARCVKIPRRIFQISPAVLDIQLQQFCERMRRICATDSDHAIGSTF